VTRPRRPSVRCSAALVAAVALALAIPAGAAARYSGWRIESYSLSFTEHATAASSPCAQHYDGPAGSNPVRATSEDARITLDHWTYPSRDPLFAYDELADGPGFRGNFDRARLTQSQHVTQTVIDCDTQATSPRSCESSSPYGGGLGWGMIESMTTNRRRHTVTLEWGSLPDSGYDCAGDIGLGPPVALNSLVKTRLSVRAFYPKRTRIHFSRTWSGNDGSGATGTETLSGTLILRRTTEPGSCYPGRHPDRHFVCSRR
jgi:hypothetical protein